MSSAEPTVANDLEVFRHQAGMIRMVVPLNLDGITQAESLVQPEPNGNCLNWVVGHLVCVYDQFLPFLGQQPVIPGGLKRYERGSPPIRDAAEARDIHELAAAWDEVSRRVDAGLAALSPDALDRPAPFSPTDDPNETGRSLISTVLFHQAYHVGQTGILRRIAGKAGAIA